MQSVNYERAGDFYDLTVPGAHHYAAHGILHHNTGKTRAVLEKVNAVCMRYPGARCSLVRESRESMSETILVTWERDVWPRGWPLTPDHQRRTRSHYDYPNGSCVVVAGMDTPGRVLSGEYDLIAVLQAEELKLEAWETLLSRLRAPSVPYKQAIADCNPAHPGHWLNVRASAGSMTRLLSRHRDNPTVTPEYLATLGRLTGARRLRLLDGKWAGSEGIVYDRWDRAVHVKVREGPWARIVVGVDYGYTNPTAALRACIDGDGRVHVEAEGYGRGLNESEQVTLVRRLASGAESVCVDPSAAGLRAALHSDDLPVVEADNDVVAGINRIQDRLVIAGDGLPRLTVDPSCANLIREFESYEWLPDKPKDAPKKENDHCLVAGTLVTTAEGPKPIEYITHHDEVWTRAGWRSVTWAAMTSAAAQVYRVKFSDGRTLVGTASHPVWTTADGFIQLRDLRSGSCVDALKNPTLIVKPAPSGVVTTGRFRRGGTSITGTKTRSTTFSATWNASLQRFTLPDTLMTTTGRRKRGKPAAGGTGAKRGVSGTRNTRGVSGRVEFRPELYAWSAEWPTQLTSLRAPSSVTRTAKRRLSVVGVEKLDVEPVYNLSVRDQPEFYANGVLVHNCMDALRYLVMHLDGSAPVTVLATGEQRAKTKEEYDLVAQRAALARQDWERRWDRGEA